MTSPAIALDAAAPRVRAALAWPLVVAVAAVFVLRVVLGASAGASLHVDEAQYWDWSRTLQWAYYSKPPVIAVLIKASQALFGDGEAGLRLLTMACYPLAALLLAWLAAQLAGYGAGAGADRDLGAATAAGRDAAGAPARAAAWAAAIFLASPLAAMLGLVATTDAPLVLSWAAALAALWAAAVQRRRAAWLVFGAVVGIGLLSKYTFAAFVAGAALWLALRGDRRSRIGFVAALAVALVVVAPHLVWSAREGWVTLQHTAQITVGAAARQTRPWLALAEFVGAQWLIFGPLVLPAWWLLRRRRTQEPGAPKRHGDAWAFLGWTTLPLVAAGVVQAWRGGAQINWIAPAHLAATLAVALVLAGDAPAVRRRLLGVLVVQFVLLSVLAVAPRIGAVTGQRLPVLLDAWARMRGWDAALARVAPLVQRTPDALVVATTRTLMAQAAYHWRALPVERAAWAPGAGGGNHYERRCPWRPGQGRMRPLFVLSEGPLPAELAARAPGLLELERVVVQINRGRKVELTLWHGATTGTAVPAAEPPACR